MFSNGQTTGLIGISTRWIDEDGNPADLAEKLGRLGEDVSDFAIHTMGWIRCTTIGAFEEYSFDARSVHLNGLAGLLKRLTGGDGSKATRLRCIEVTTARGTTKISDDRPDRMVSLVLKCMEIANPRAPRDSIRRGRMDRAALHSLDDPVAARLIAVWQESGAYLRSPLLDVMSDAGINRGIKVMVPQGETFQFMRYQGSPNAPWDRATWRGFEGGTLDQVIPDRGMIESVKASTRTALSLKEPLVEFCEGVILASDGLKEYQWYRISLPVDLPLGSRAGYGDAGQGVLVLLSPIPQNRKAA